jgi:hypothetical protein
MVAVAVAAALVAAAVPVFASGAGPAAATTAGVLSRGALIVCPQSVTGAHGNAAQARHARQVALFGCRCGQARATGPAGAKTTLCNPCVRVAAAPVGPARRLAGGRAVRLRRYVRAVCACPLTGATGATGAKRLAGARFSCGPCPFSGSTGASGPTARPPVPGLLPAIACAPCPPTGASGASGSTALFPDLIIRCGCPLTGSTGLSGPTGSTAGGAANWLCRECPPAGSTGLTGMAGATGSSGVSGLPAAPLVRCHPPCPLAATGAILKGRHGAWWRCWPCPGSPPSIGLPLLGRARIAAFWCRPPCPSASTGAAASTGGNAQTAIGCICVSLRSGAGGTPRPTNCRPQCPQPAATASRGAIWICCAQLGSSGPQTPCTPPPRVVCQWPPIGATGASGSTGSTGATSGRCPLPPHPCPMIAGATSGATATCGPVPCGPLPQSTANGPAYVCPMTAPAPTPGAVPA